MMHPEWVSSDPTGKPDAMTLNVLQSLEDRKLVYSNFGRWYLTDSGLAAQSSLDDDQSGHASVGENLDGAKIGSLSPNFDLCNNAD